ncbi:unnamed protein product [Peronospora belbahrii]|uniref:Uncharacterized protein n=1 Tax=Peronospora belbahrii TaxID=622444 RepID=A0AAU9L978_9STRA|nr:unnamed protein product [Peronospora belbahrii]
MTRRISCMVVSLKRSFQDPRTKRSNIFFDDLSIIQEAALLIVTSGVISLADLETVIGYRLSEDLNNDEEALTMDSDVTWETPTCMSDCNRIMDNSSSESTQEASQQVTNLTTTDDTVVLQQQSTPRQTLHKPSKWICVGYGRYVKERDIVVRD